jgi:hypothetical protein
MPFCLIEGRRFRQLGSDNAHGRQVHTSGRKISKGLRKMCCGIGVVKGWRCHVAKHGEVAGLHRVVERGERIA